MKVWEVKLSLCIDIEGDWINFFSVETDGKDYRLVGDTYYENKKGWAINTIPSAIKVKHIAGSYLVQYGLEEHPSDEELKAIKSEMKRILNEYINDEFERCKADYHFKIKGLSLDDK